MSKWVDKHLKVIFMAPVIIFVLVMIVAPMLYTIGLSFCDWSMSNIKPPEFVGASNYIDLFHDDRFWGAVLRTFLFVIGAIVVETLLGIGIAVLINRKFFATNVIKTVFILPVVATPVAVGMVWKLILEPTIGYANVLVSAFGLPKQQFLASASQVLPSLIMIDVWEWTPMVMLMVLAGLMTIPGEMYESAKVDGASPVQRFFHITIPLASPAILSAILLRLIDVIKTFDIIYATTQGGPGYASETINILATVTSFQYFQFGDASAITVMFFLVVILIACIFMFVKKKVEVDY